MKSPIAMILRGTANCGKTETLKKLAFLLLENGAVVLKCRNPYKEDYWYVFKYMNESIALSTQGDIGEELQDWYQWSGQCSVYIFPCRTKGNTFEFANKTFNTNQILWHSKWSINDDVECSETKSDYIANRRTAVNFFQAEELKANLDYIISM